MLNEYQIAELKRHMIDPAEVADFNPETGRVTMQDGQERQLAEVILRVMGYHRPVNFWNEGKQAEHETRRMFTEAKAFDHAKQGE